MDGSALTPFAWFFMLFSIGAVSALTLYCFYRILSGGRLADTDERAPVGPTRERAAEGERPEP